ncbi:MAG: T9SS type A sorting domain-containing protein [Bacteroidota bacterium]
MKYTNHLNYGTFLFVLLLSLSACQTRVEKPAQDIHPSGAAYQLDHWTHMRTYPDGQLHRKEYELAYEQKKLEAQLRGNNETTFEALGPKNIGGRTLCIAFHPSNPGIIYVGSASGGLWKSTTAGIGVEAWERVEIGFPVLGVGAIAIQPDNPDVMYIGTGEVYNFSDASIGNINRITRGTYGIGILKTEDGGITWTKSLDWEIDDFTGVQDLIIHPDHPETIFAATTEGLYRSENAGQSWDVLNNGIEMAVDVELNPDNADLVYASYGNINSPTSGIYRSSDSGATFTKLTSGLPSEWEGKTLLGISPSSPNIIYASIAEPFNSIGLFQTTDGGDNWSLISNEDVARWQGWYSHDVAVNPNNPDNFIYVGIDAWRSINGGNSIDRMTEWFLWEFGQVPVGGPEGPPNYVHADIHQVKYHPLINNLVYVVGDGGIFASANSGLDWAGRNGGYQTQQFYANFSNSSTDSLIAIGGMQDNSTAIYIGDDAWVRVLGGDGMCTAISQTNDNVLYGSSQFLGLQVSFDQGNSWEFIAPFNEDAPLFNAPFELAPSNQGRLYAGSKLFHRSNNGGFTWTDNNIPGNNAILNIAVSPIDDDKVYISTADFQLSAPPTILKTTDAGQSWTPILGLPDRNAADIAIHPLDDEMVYIVFSGFNTEHVFKSEDGGSTWIAIDNGLPNVPTNSIVIDPLYPDHLYVGNDLGVYYSIDGGNTWASFSNGLPSAILAMHLSISPSNRKLRVASHGSGVYEGELLEPSSVSTETPQLADLLQVKLFPNPVEDQLTVQFDLAERKAVRLQLFSSNGQRIRTLDQGMRSEGEHQLNYSVADLAGGVYYLSLVIDGKEVSSKVFIKDGN